MLWGLNIKLVHEVAFKLKAICCIFMFLTMHYWMMFKEIFQELNVLLRFIDFSKFLQHSSKMTNWGIVSTSYLFGLYVHKYIKASYSKLTWRECLLRCGLRSVWVVLKISIVLYMRWMNNLKLLCHRTEGIFQLHSFKEKFFLLSKQTVVLGGFLSRIQICMWNYCVCSFSCSKG